MDTGIREHFILVSYFFFYRKKPNLFCRLCRQIDIFKQRLKYVNKKQTRRGVCPFICSVNIQSWDGEEEKEKEKRHGFSRWNRRLLVAFLCFSFFLFSARLVQCHRSGISLSAAQRWVPKRTNFWRGTFQGNILFLKVTRIEPSSPSLHR